MNSTKLLAYAALTVLYLDVLAASDGSASLIIVRSDAVRIHFEVEIADTDKERRRGLMGREYIAPRHGMWFDFELSGALAMWMKDTPVSLDMLFVNEAGFVVYMRERTEPLSLERVKTTVPARYVLELNAGEAQIYAIGVGARVVIPKP